MVRSHEQTIGGNRRSRVTLFLIIFLVGTTITKFWIDSRNLNIITEKKSVEIIGYGKFVDDREVFTRGGYNNILDELDELTRGYKAKSMDCPAPLVIFHNRIARDNETSRQIPKILHFSMKSRCLPQDLNRNMNRWIEQFPSYSVFFHDDEAVARLINLDWREFPKLHTAMNCVLYKGAMTIDIWRVLVLFTYGGVYSDIDNWPADTVDEHLIPESVSAFFFSDPWNRPSQWFMATEKAHPMLYLGLRMIIENVLNLEMIGHPKVVFVTGPHVMGYAYKHWLLPESVKMLEEEPKYDCFQSKRTHKGMLGKLVTKLPYHSDDGEPYIYVKKDFNKIVLHEGKNVTVEKRIKMESGYIHWKTDKAINGNMPGRKVSCKEHLAKLEEEKKEEHEE